MTKPKQKPMPAAVAKPYDAKPHEQEALARYREHATTAPPRVKIEMQGEAWHTSIDHPDKAIGQLMLMEAIGTKDLRFFDVLLSQLVNAGTQGREPDERQLNFMLSVIKGIQPRDQMEAMLAAQMAAIHNSMMTFARRLAHVENIAQQDSASNALNKLARTFTTQLEALKKYRSTGEQKMTVQHVQVNDGGQAIVGNVSTGGGVSPKKLEPTP